MELGFSYADLYPNWKGVDTSNLAVPEADDLEALNENTKLADESKTTEAKGKNIFLALGVLLALVIFFGGK